MIIIMNNTNIIGYCGSFLISINLLPQIIYIYKNKNAESISVLTNIINICSSSLMIYYAYSINTIPIIVSNVMIFSSSLVIIFLKYYFRK